MADDRGLEGPADARIVEAPTGLTPLELKAGEEARRKMVEHLGNRPVLTMDDLVELKDVRPRLEKEMSLPGIKGKVYFFSIDGTLRGTRFTGCLFAGECILVQEERGSFEKALGIAKDGVNETIRLAIEVYEEQNRLIVTTESPVKHVQVGVGGRRAAATDAPLARDPKLRAMLLDIFKGRKG